MPLLSLLKATRLVPYHQQLEQTCQYAFSKFFMSKR